MENKIMSVRLYKSEVDEAKNSKEMINKLTIEIAKPSIPSIKFIEFIIATIKK